MTAIASAVANARKSLELEGFIFTTEEINLLEQIAKNEKTAEDMLEFADAYVDRLRATDPEIFTAE